MFLRTGYIRIVVDRYYVGTWCLKVINENPVERELYTCAVPTNVFSDNYFDGFFFCLLVEVIKKKLHIILL